ncbi:hypothetical protein [Arcobacter sp. s6]|uniref:hypothetical protein n=1 Tax=Arcobacter sp. s6 TaxID=3230363 RepID=UPI0034A067E7
MQNSLLEIYISKIESKFFTSKSSNLENLFKTINYIEWGVKSLVAILMIYIEKKLPRDINFETRSLISSLDGARSYGDWISALDRINNLFENLEYKESSNMSKNIKILLKAIDDVRLIKIRNSLIGHGIYDEKGIVYKKALNEINSSEICRSIKNILLSSMKIIDLSKNIMPYLIIEEGFIGIPNSITLTSFPSKIEYIDYLNGKIKFIIEPFGKDLIKILTSKKYIKDDSGYLEKLLLNQKEEISSIFVNPECFYENLNSLLSNYNLIRVIGQKGIGKSSLAYMCEENLIFTNEIILLPLSNGLWKSKYYFFKKLSNSIGHPVENWEDLKNIIKEMQNNIPIVTVVLDGIDEVKRNEINFIFEIIEVSLKKKNINWIFFGRDDSEINNEFSDFFKINKDITTLEISTSKEYYIKGLYKWIDANVNDEYKEDAKFYIENLNKTFLDLKNWNQLKKFKCNISDEKIDIENVINSIYAKNKDSLPFKMAILIYIVNKPLNIWELSTLLLNNEKWKDWFLIREKIIEYGFMFNKIGEEFSLAHIEWGRVSLKIYLENNDKSWFFGVIEKIYFHYTEEINYDLKNPSSLKSFWEKNFFNLCLYMNKKMIKQFLYPDDFKNSIFVGIEKLYLEMNISDDKYLYLYESLEKIYDKFEIIDYRFFKLFLILFNCPNRNIQWKACEFFYQLNLSEKESLNLIDYLLSVLDNFLEEFNTYEFSAQRKGSIASSLLSTILEIAKVKIDERDWKNSLQLKKLYSISRNILQENKLKYLARFIELLLNDDENLELNNKVFYELYITKQKENDEYLINFLEENINKKNILTDYFIEEKLLSEDWNIRRSFIQNAIFQKNIGIKIAEKLLTNLQIRGKLLGDKDPYVRDSLYKLIEKNISVFCFDRIIQNNLEKKLDRINSISVKEQKFLFDGKSEKDKLEEIIELMDANSLNDILGSVIIIEGIDGLLFHKKTEGYKPEKYVGKLGLLGGNYEKEDKTPTEIILRELNEEVNDDEIISNIIENLIYEKCFLINDVSRKITGKVYLYSSKINRKLKNIKINEGELVILEKNDLFKYEYIWCHEFMINTFFDKKYIKPNDECFVKVLIN